MENSLVDVIGFLAGAGLSLLFSYVPGFKNWFETMESEKKQLTLLVLIAILVFGAYGLAFTGYVNLFSADVQGFMDAVVVFFLALVANAGTYKATNYIGRD